MDDHIESVEPDRGATGKQKVIVKVVVFTLFIIVVLLLPLLFTVYVSDYREDNSLGGQRAWSNYYLRICWLNWYPRFPAELHTTYAHSMDASFVTKESYTTRIAWEIMLPASLVIWAVALGLLFKKRESRKTTWWAGATVLLLLLIVVVSYVMTVRLLVFGNTAVILLPNNEKMEFAWIEPGEFTMGGPEEPTEDESHKSLPRHKVTLTKGFWLSKYELTVGQAKALAGNEVPSESEEGDRLPFSSSGFSSSDHKTELMLIRLASIAGRPVRLPTEAQWEYACRAGMDTRYSFGDSKGDLHDYAWFAENTEEADRDREPVRYGDGEKVVESHQTQLARPRPVGLKKPNGFGLYDMHGNVAEICSDQWGRYSCEDAVDPEWNSPDGENVVRGGCSRCSALDCSSYSRSVGRMHINIFHLGSSPTIGYRICMPDLE